LTFFFSAFFSPLSFNLSFARRSRKEGRGGREERRERGARRGGGVGRVIGHPRGTIRRNTHGAAGVTADTKLGIRAGRSTVSGPVARLLQSAVGDMGTGGMSAFSLAMIAGRVGSTHSTRHPASPRNVTRSYLSPCCIYHCHDTREKHTLMRKRSGPCSPRGISPTSASSSSTSTCSPCGGSSTPSSSPCATWSCARFWQGWPALPGVTRLVTWTIPAVVD
jgi:hypothetical protein